MTRYELRSCSADDLALTYEITKQAMASYVEQTWGCWDDDEQRRKHQQDYTPATHRLVLVAGHVAGLVAVEDEPTHLWLVKLYLLEGFRGRGLGSTLLAQVMAQARAQGKRVRLRVLRVNTGARRLYERHGFSVVRDTPERLFMESGPRAADPHNAGLPADPPPIGPPMHTLRDRLTPAAVLPTDPADATLIGRAWLPDRGGPVPVLVHADGLHDLSPVARTVSQLLELESPLAAIRAAGALPRVGSLAEALAHSDPLQRDPARPWLLAPCDLQALKAAGVTFAASLLERVIEERARGDAAHAEAVRRAVVEVIGDDLARVRPGSPAAARLKEVLLTQGLWSQYLEVGIGPDAEIFTKSQPLSAVGVGAEVGIHPQSRWNNPEPEVVLAINSRGQVLGAALGNDVNLRDFEGRSALLLGKAKDNNASCAIGPFIRLFDAGFGIDDVRACEVGLRIDGPDGFELAGASAMSMISRDPLDLAAQAIGATHRYPDGLMLFLGTMFAPTQDRFAPGQGFTHAVGDVVTVQTPRLGALINRVNHADQTEPWTFGIGALIDHLARQHA